MSSYEYTVIPAPARAEKSKGGRSGIDRFAATLTDTLNEMAREGWDYVRAEVLPAEERSGLTSRNTVYHNLLVFRRARDAAPTRALPVEEITQTAPPAAAEPIRPPDPPKAQPALSQPAPSQPAPAAQVRAPFSQPMRAMPKQQPQARVPEPPLTAPPQPAPPQGPRLGPATR